MTNSFYTEDGDYDDEREAHREGMLGFFREAEQEIAKLAPPIGRALNEASYTMGEINLWIDQEGGISTPAIIQAWALVETLRRNGGQFPAKLRM
ncbi:hypothetical protein HOU02_gp246 [Caulobacter phage CcrBL9]|uniref:Uncharacterized protein n=1 Tax=Caulobacter phage CcrBL9 TaxID=2283270 RepID=A0A385EFM9_9CAUD|nr:hypothetical protein HOU02_gp246 [Caulobacter phage CcrBL9]AXQ69479.1 hypothetical protein CcrBL9_gp455 [Caulobacter phage CcrBL9]